jgi:hypothetical protein
MPALTCVVNAFVIRAAVSLQAIRSAQVGFFAHVASACSYTTGGLRGYCTHGDAIKAAVAAAAAGKTQTAVGKSTR